MRRYRVTVRADNVELRGFVDGVVTLMDLSRALTGVALVVASEAAEDYNPFVSDDEARAGWTFQEKT